MRELELIIIGAGPAGATAAIQCVRLGLSPVVLDRAGRAGGLVENAQRLENYPGLAPAPSGRTFARRLRQGLCRFDVEVRRETVTSISRSRSGYRLSGSFGALGARCVIAAVGTRPRHVAIRGAAALGGLVFHEVRELLVRGPSRVGIIGAGEAALDSALSLAALGVEVRIFCRGARPAASGVLLDRVTQSERITLETHSRVSAVRPFGSRAALEVKERCGVVTCVVDALLIAAGRVSTLPDLVATFRVAPSAPLEHRPGLFIAGDARLGGLGQTGIAVGDGLLAAAAAERFLKQGPGSC